MVKTKGLFLLFIIFILLINSLHARYYNPAIGRFITADTVTPGGGADLQGLNRYSYCINNPVKYVDTTGHEPDAADATYTYIGQLSKMQNIVLIGDCFGMVLRDEINLRFNENSNVKFIHKGIPAEYKVHDEKNGLFGRGIIPRVNKEYSNKGEEIGLYIITLNILFKKDMVNLSEEINFILKQTGGSQVIFIEPTKTVPHKNNEGSNLTDNIVTELQNNMKNEFTRTLYNIAKRNKNLLILPLGDEMGNMPRQSDRLHLTFPEGEKVYSDSVINYIQNNENVNTKIREKDYTSIFRGEPE